VGAHWNKEGESDMVAAVAEPVAAERSEGWLTPELENSDRRQRTGASHPCLFQISTRVTLTERGRALGRRATLDDISDTELDRFATDGFDWLWFLGLWQTGTAARAISVGDAALRREFNELLSDFREADVCGSCFAIRAWEVHGDFGGDAALKRLRQRMHHRGMRLMADFVPNHTAPDHDWVRTHPDYYLQGTEEQWANDPVTYARIGTARGPVVIARGRDPYFPAWPDTLQLNYANADLQEAMARVLERLALRCDGVRCDMAMLVLSDVFERTWGKRATQFWPLAIRRARAVNPEFVFMAEAYWDLEWNLQQLGFDYTYDKRLYDRLRQGEARPVHDHLLASADFQRRCVRFLENHDEPRAAAAFPDGQHQAAAIVTYLCPGLRFFHQGQRDGLTKRISVHLNRTAPEPVNARLREFYDRLLSCLRNPIVREGEWRLVDCTPAWDGNSTHASYICWVWRARTSAGHQAPLVVVVNFAPQQSQCRAVLPMPELRGKTVRLQDVMGEAVYQRSGDEMAGQGLFLDLPAWGFNVFELTTGQ
jgi:hypothetical protein